VCWYWQILGHQVRYIVHCYGLGGCEVTGRSCALTCNFEISSRTHGRFEVTWNVVFIFYIWIPSFTADILLGCLMILDSFWTMSVIWVVTVHSCSEQPATSISIDSQRSLQNISSCQSNCLASHLWRLSCWYLHKDMKYHMSSDSFKISL
jgi:hypothetical protein